MKLQTEIPIPKETSGINYDSKLFLLGSCFSENIGGKFRFYKFQTLQNPFGIFFHPFAIENFLKQLTAKKTYTQADLVFYNERWHCFEAHSVLSSPHKEEILQQLNDRLRDAREFLKKTSHVFLTFGTAWTYQYKETGSYVANCHKIPQQKFRKQLIAAEEIQQSIQRSVKFIRQINASIKFVFSISPVRHLKDGFVENQQSKAHLIIAVHRFIASEKNAFYFPSYEILLDELRDYRFYKKDLVHPNVVAIEYIWEKFVGSWIEPRAQETMKAVESIQRGLQHKAFNPGSEAHRKFVVQLQQKIERLQAQFPCMDFD